MEREALKLALKDLKWVDNWLCEKPMPECVAKLRKAITAIKAALAQPAQEPRNVRERWNVALDGNDLLVCFNDHEKGDKCQYERYSPQRTWVGLTDEEYDEIWRMDLNNKELMDKTIIKLKEKNNGT